MNRNITLLDEKTINKIAAGEVVERPSSVVKELVENSIDANSKSITIEIVDGGKSYIRVTDDGVGISKDNLSLAFLRHSTSKISVVEDLETVTTLGFRGEALSSISSVSQLEIITKTNNDTTGRKVSIKGGSIDSDREIGCPDGTTIIVNNLFYNVPVRQQFLKSNNVETSYISDIIYKLAISHPDISFRYINNGKQIIKTPGNNDMKSTAYSLLGKDFIESTLELNLNKCGISLSGFICKPSFNRGNRSSQYIFVNGRYIKDIGISRSIEQSYKTLLPNNKYPVFLIFINMDSTKVDVNVHPTKTEVRFSNKSEIESLVYNTSKELLGSNNLIPKVSFEKKQNNMESTHMKEEQVILDKITLDNYSKKPTPNMSENYQDILKILDFNINQSTDADNVINEKNETIYEPKIYEYKEDKPKFPDMHLIGKLFNTYILCEDRISRTLYIIDQHAAHERVMYEKIKLQLINQNISTQNLLAPDIIELTDRELNLVNDNMKVFLNLGFDLENFGSNAVALRGVPMILGTPNSRSLFLDILDNLDTGVESSYELNLDKIMKLACTSAIKANDNIKDVEITKLIDDLEITKEPFTCPHGRPIIIEMTNNELEKRFKRIQ